LVAFNYVGAGLVVTQNLTINRYSVNAATWSEWATTAMQAVGALVIWGGVIWWFLLRK
jgi:hypothetical protein